MKRCLLALSLALCAAAAAAAPATYELDPNHTQVLAQWSHFGFSNPVANFGEVDGTLVYDPEDVAASSVQVVLPLSGLQAFVPRFNDHLRSDDFFDAANHPVVTFRSTRVEAKGEDRLAVTGDLTIKGITREVVLDVRLNKTGQGSDGRAKLGFDASTAVKRSDFDLGKFAPNVSDQVDLRITTEAIVPRASEQP
ncbi:YceI family protein [Luteimonas vadosa]|uniref:Lipid/polyisoprenoid-binding YceI-like domain-containing protein n=1 Tax=Luteimonas vadosa TaxID=1165507 RepID=A0ABP9DT71_9GAMM